MNLKEAQRILSLAQQEDEPVVLPRSILSKLTIDDMIEGGSFQIGALKDGIIHLEWNGSFHRTNNLLVGEADYSWTRKYWYSPLGLEQYLDLIRRSVETRHRMKGDVELISYDDDGAYVVLRFQINTTEKNLARAYDNIRKIEAEIEEVADQLVVEVGKRTAEVAASLSGWGSESLNFLLNAVETVTSTDDKGRTLEELCSRLFSSMPGFTVTDRVRTETEEIDISIVNDSSEPRLRREGALIIAECKNWTGRCGKNEFVQFREKIANRSGRCTLGFLISWNGFADTVTKEMLRGSREGILVVPITGEDIRSAVRTSDFSKVLLTCWDKAVNT